MLPEGGNTPWPPPGLDQVREKIRTWSAWWSGDPERLEAIYGGDPVGAGAAFFASESGGFKRGVRNAAETVRRRWFWGNRNLSGQPRQRLHVPIGGDIAAASADLLFSEPPTITAADGRTQARLAELLDDGAHATLLEAAELASAHGGVYLRVQWDTALRAQPWLSPVAADTAVPDFRQGRLTGVTFWKVVASKGRLVWRHLERHEPGRILHGLYKGAEDELGQPVPLTDSPTTAPLATVVDQDQAIPTGAPALTAVYVPNMRPNRVWRGLPEAAPLGRSDLAGVEPLMDALDLTWSSWMRDVELGKARLVVPHAYMEGHGPGRGATFQLDKELYEPVNSMDPGEGSNIEQVQFRIRVEEHTRTVTALKTEIIATAGYSAATFGLDSEGPAQTATEVASRNRRSLITRGRKIRYWRPALGEILGALLAVDQAVFATGVTPARPAIEWPAAVSPDPEAEARTLRELDTAGAISTEQKVRRLHPEWDDDQVAAEVALIAAAQAVPPVPDPATFTGEPDAGQP